MKLQVGSLSDVGRSRDHNEDFLGTYCPPEAGQRRLKGDLFLVADGIGGHQSGEVASRMAVEQIIQTYSAAAGKDRVAELVRAVEAANTAIYSMGQGQDRRWRMGTTLVGALILDRELHVVNVGDSRAYLVRDARAEQISQDHSLVAEQVRMGLLDAEQAKNQEYRSAITRALGSKPDVEVDVFARTLQAGDIVVLCTDGLSGLVTDEEITGVVNGQPPPQAAAALVALANARGGKDNITTIVVKMQDQAALPSRLFPHRGGQGGARPRRRVWWPVWGLVGAALLLAALLAVVPFTLGLGQDVPRTPPVVAPIELGDGQPGTRDELARLLGYQDELDVLFKVGFAPGQPWPPLKPRGIYVLLTGRIVRADGEPCQFLLDMGGPPYYTVRCPVGAVRGPRPAKGEQVQVLGILADEPARQIEPVAMSVNKITWLGLNSEWKNWYTAFEPGKRMLVYTVAGPYTVLLDRRVSSGQAVAVYGPWRVQDDRHVTLESLEYVFRLDGGVYRLVP